MSPEKIVAKTKEFVITKGLVIIITASMAMGGAAYKLNDTQEELEIISQNMKDVQEYMFVIQKDMFTMGQDIALTKKDISYIVDDMSKLTAQVGERVSNRAKIRRK